MAQVSEPTGQPESVPSADLLSQVGTVPGLAQVLGRLGVEEVPGPAQAAAAVEFVLEGLHLNRRLNKERRGGGIRYAR